MPCATLLATNVGSGSVTKSSSVFSSTKSLHFSFLMCLKAGLNAKQWSSRDWMASHVKESRISDVAGPWRAHMPLTNHICGYRPPYD